MSDPDQYPTLPPGTQAEAVRGEGAAPLYVLLHPGAPRWALVNATGLEVARLCDGTRSAPDIAALLAARYGLAPAAVLPNVQACLDDLARACLLTSSPPPQRGGQTEGAPQRDPGTPTPPPPLRQGRSQRGGHPWRLHLYLTEECNLRCRHCGVVYGPARTAQLDGDTVRRLVDQAVAAGCEGIAFGGGEPLLRADALDLLRHSAGQVKTLLATNGLLIDGPAAAALVEMGALVQISLDGATAEVHDAVRGRGAFARAWQAVEALRRAGIGPRLSLNVTLMRPNAGQAAEIVALAAERGVAGVRFTMLQHAGRAVEAWDDLAPSDEQCAETYRILYGVTGHRPSAIGHLPLAVSPGLAGLELSPPEEGMWCRMGRLLVVDAAGEIYPCALLAEPAFSLGNVARTSLAQALASDQLAGLVTLCERRRDEIEECRACAWRHFCQAGCPASAWRASGTWHAADGLCDLRRDLYRELIARRGRAAVEECGL